jgi:hypothetical protein
VDTGPNLTSVALLSLTSELHSSQHDAHEFLTDLISVLETEQIALLKQKLYGTVYHAELESPRTAPIKEDSDPQTSESIEKSIQSESVIRLPPLHLSVIPTVRRLLSVVDVTLRCTNCNELRHKKVPILSPPP